MSEDPLNTMRPVTGDGAPPPYADPPPTPGIPSAPAALVRPNAVEFPGIPDDRPELKVAAAFGGSLVLALLLKRLAR